MRDLRGHRPAGRSAGVLKFLTAPAASSVIKAKGMERG